MAGSNLIESMRDKNLLQLFLILNVALAGCFVVYLLLSSNGQPKVTAAVFPGQTKSNATAKAGPDRAANAPDDREAFQRRKHPSGNPDPHLPVSESRRSKGSVVEIGPSTR